LLKKTIKVKSIAVIRKDDKILVYQYDPDKNPYAFRSPGGKVQYGELSERTLIREIKEELGLSIKNINKLGIIENRDTYRGRYMHEIVFVYQVEFKDNSQYHKDSFKIIESGGEENFTAYWIPIQSFISGKYRMYPRELIHLLMNKSGASSEVIAPIIDLMNPEIISVN